MSIDELMKILENVSFSEREQIVEQLVTPGDSIVEPLISILNNNNGRQSWLAAIALSHIKDERVLPALVAALPKVSGAVQVMLIEMLGNLGDKQAVYPLIEHLNNQNLIIQMAVVKALTKIDDKRAVAPLMNTLEQTEESSLRYTIIEALGNLGDSKAVTLIQRFAGDENRHVRHHVERALDKLVAKN